MTKKTKDTLTKDELLEVFKEFDRDGNGFITPDELKIVMEYYLKEQLTEDEIYKMVQEADTLNADAQIDKEEFLAIMMGF